MIAAPASDASDEVLISNIDQADGDVGNLSFYSQGQAFTTGANAPGYLLTSVEVEFARVGGVRTYSVGIWSSDEEVNPSGDTNTIDEPHTKLGDLTCGALTAQSNDQVITCTAAGSGIDLEAQKTYVFVIDASGGTNYVNNLRNTNSDVEDSGGKPDWSIEDSSIFKARAQAIGSGAWTSWPNSRKIRINGSAKLAAVLDLSVTVASATSLKVDWNAVAGATIYSVTWKSSTQEYSNERGRILASTSYTITGLKTGQTYTVRVTAIGSGLKAIDQSETTITLTAPVPGLRVAAASAIGLRVNWNAVAGVTIYSLSWKSSGQEYDNSRSRTSNLTSGTIGSLTTGETYTVRVQALDTSNTPPTVVAESEIITILTAPTVVTLEATNIGSSSATLTISGRAERVSWWYKRTAPSAGTCTSVEAGRTVVSLAGLNAGTSYTYKAYSDSTCATEIADESFTTLAAIPGLSVTAASATSLKVDWNAVAGANGGYVVQWKSTTQLYTVVGQFASIVNSLTAYTIPGLTTGETYTVRVQAIGSDLVSIIATSEFTLTLTDPNPDQSSDNRLDITVTNTGFTSARVTWTPVGEVIKSRGSPLGAWPQYSYDLYYKSGSESYSWRRNPTVYTGTNSPIIPPYADLKGLTRGKTYTVRVRSYTIELQFDDQGYELNMARRTMTGQSEVTLPWAGLVVTCCTQRRGMPTRSRPATTSRPCSCRGRRCRRQPWVRRSATRSRRQGTTRGMGSSTRRSCTTGVPVRCRPGSPSTS